MDAAAPSTLTDYLGVVRRRWWIALLVIALATGSALLVSRLENSQVSSVRRGSAVQSSAGQHPQAAGQHHHRRAGRGHAGAGCRDRPGRTARVEAGEGEGYDAAAAAEPLGPSPPAQPAISSILGDRPLGRFRAKLLATSYARAYATFANKSGVALIEQTLKPLRSEAHKLAAKIRAAGGFQADLVAQYHQALGTISGLQLARQQQQNSTQVAQGANSATKVSPKVTRNVLLGLGWGSSSAWP
jgi:hypothetical protein